VSFVVSSFRRFVVSSFRRFVASPAMGKTRRVATQRTHSRSAGACGASVTSIVMSRRTLDV
jgi:hypothetical protein